MPPELVAFAAAGGVSLLAAAALVWGLHGRRVDDHPVCRRCGFDLFGRSAPSAARA